MRVIHAFKDYYPPTRGGIELHIHDVVHHLPGFDFSVLTSSRSHRLMIERDGSVEVIRAPEYLRPASTPVTPVWRKYLRDPALDIVHLHTPNPFGELAMLAARAGSALVITFHAEIIGRRLALPFFTPFQQALLRKARRIVVSSPRLLDTSGPLVHHRDRAEVIPFGIDAAAWKDRPELADNIREAHPGPLVVFLGRLSYYKGLDVLIESLRRVEATCLMIGDGPERGVLEQQARTLNDSRKVVFLGEVPDGERPAYLHAADLFVLPSTSRAECFGIAMLEAMACSTPAISTELGTGTSWLNQHNVTGLVVRPGDPEALANAIKELLTDHNRRAEMGRAAFDRVQSQFTRSQMLDALASLYRSL